MARIIGIDYGTRRVGIAATDPMQLIASPLETIPNHKVIAFLQRYIKSESVEKIIVGWPLDLSGRAGYTTQLVGQFLRLLSRYFPHIPTQKYDERYTTKLAAQELSIAGKKTHQQKGHLDAASASLLLQSYMQHR